MAHWLYMSLEAAGFMIFSAVMWLILRRADTERDAGTARQPVRAVRRALPARDRSGEVPVLSGRPR
ncbi:MAG: hypothetical protein J2P30_27810 [Actinobacteria bacterium]|nr:hypothetical protein [Actinomycetota bacterium]